jgi:YD repeat-containing protein
LKRIFDRIKTIIQTEQDDYETLIDLSGYPTSIYVRKDFTPLDDDPGRLDAFDVAQWYFGSYWNRIKTKTITSYAGGIAYTQKTDYFYGTTTNIQPDSIVTTDSKGITLLYMMRYPNTYAVNGDPALAGYSSLTAKNIVAPVVYETSYRNGVQMQEKKTIYKDWFGNSAVISPEKVQLRESSSDALHDVLLYKQYDANGNPVHLQKVNDFFLTYIWDNVLETPIAEIKNASPNQVAFSSFENNALGGWSITSGATTSSAPYTGSNSFTGTLQRTVTMTGTINYFITLWTSSAATPTVNGASGTVVRTSNGFNLYLWKIPVTNSGAITVTGTQIDEVRLFPEGSEMQTLTYKPFIGPSTTTDANNHVTFYNYDSNNRLQIVKDQDGNVEKTIEYHYQNQ